MKKLTLTLFAFFFFALSSKAHSSALLEDAFARFYDDQSISFNKCGVNIQKFLQYLKEQKVTYKKGFVVSVHEDYAHLNHFDARWGSQEKYENGITYYRSNWYFHVFAVIDGLAFDFSQRGPVVMPLKEYLTKSYLPAYRTGNVFFQGHLDADTELKKYLNLRMSIYRLDDYRLRMGPEAYRGVFYELFESKAAGRRSRRMKETRLADKIVNNSNGTVTIHRPALQTEQGTFPLVAKSENICRAFGHVGSIPAETKVEISHEAEMLYLYSFITTPLGSAIDPEGDISISFREKRSNRAFNNPELHYATEVTCGSLKEILRFL